MFRIWRFYIILFLVGNFSHHKVREDADFWKKNNKLLFEKLASIKKNRRKRDQKITNSHKHTHYTYDLKHQIES